MGGTVQSVSVSGPKTYLTSSIWCHHVIFIPLAFFLDSWYQYKYSYTVCLERDGLGVENSPAKVLVRVICVCEAYPKCHDLARSLIFLVHDLLNTFNIA
jgi:hypothetical protein